MIGIPHYIECNQIISDNCDYHTQMGSLPGGMLPWHASLGTRFAPPRCESLIVRPYLI